MNDTENFAIVETDRDELRDRIEDMRRRFYRLARSADPHATRPGLDWTVQQVVAHVLCVAQRYQSLIDTRDFRRAREPSELDQINKEEMEAQMAPIPDLIAQLEALETVMDSGSTVYPTTSPKSSTAVQSFLGRSHRSTGSAS